MQNNTTARYSLFAVSIYDDAVSTYSPPIFFHTKAQAERYFTWLCQSDDNDVGRHAINHHLYHVGNFYTDVGLLDTTDSQGPVLLLSGKSIDRSK